jgi:hypothetical protein
MVPAPVPGSEEIVRKPGKAMKGSGHVSARRNLADETDISLCSSYTNHPFMKCFRDSR